MSSTATTDMSQKPQGMSEETYKEQLDRIATERRNAEHKQQVNPIIEKIADAIPPVAPYLGVKKQNKAHEVPSEKPAGPPERPDHDVPIEEFVRDQHRSNGDGVLAAGKQ